jgi:hypothetical protein
MLLILNNPNKKICLFDLNSADVGAGFSIELIDINLLPFFNCLIMNTINKLNLQLEEYISQS